MTEIYLYWSSTALLSLMYLASAITHVTKRAWVRQAITGFGYPGYLLPVLVAVKLLAILAILPRFSVAFSDLAYAGMFYHLLLSALAHTGVRRPAGAVPAAVGLVLLVLSFATQNAARATPSPYAPAVPSHQINPN
jgi:type II secretory pathway component PulF